MSLMRKNPSESSFLLLGGGPGVRRPVRAVEQLFQAQPSTKEVLFDLILDWEHLLLRLTHETSIPNRFRIQMSSSLLPLQRSRVAKMDIDSRETYWAVLQILADGLWVRPTLDSAVYRLETLPYLAAVLVHHLKENRELQRVEYRYREVQPVLAAAARLFIANDDFAPFAIPS